MENPKQRINNPSYLRREAIVCAAKALLHLTMEDDPEIRKLMKRNGVDFNIELCMFIHRMNGLVAVDFRDE